MDAKLSVEVGVPFDKALAGFARIEQGATDFVNRTGKKIDNFSRSGGQSLKSFGNTISSDLNKKITVAQGNFELFGNTLARDKAKLSAYQGALNDLLASGVKPTSTEVLNLAQNITDLEKVTAKEPLNKIGSGATKAFTALRQVAYILPGIGIAGIFNLAFEAITPLIDKLELFNTILSETAKNKILLDEATKAGNQEAAKEITSLRILYDAATNVANSVSLRNKAAKELQDRFPETFGIATKEAIKNGELKDSYDALTQSIIANARAKAIESKIADLAAKQLDAEIQKQKIQNAAANQGSRVGGSIRQDIGMGQGVTVTKEQQLSAIISGERMALKVQDSIIDNAAQGIKFLESFSTDKSLVDAITGGDPQGKKIKTVLDIFKELDLELTKIQSDVTGTFGDKFTDKINAYKKAIDGLIEVGLKPGSKEIENLQNKIIDLQDTLNIGKLKAVSSPVTSTTGAPSGTALIPISEKTTADYKNNADQLKNQNKLLADDFESSFNSIASSIGNALANGTNVFDAFGSAVLSSIGDILVQFGKLSIAAGIASTALGKALSNPFNPANGIAAIAAGVALVAVGSLVKGFSSNVGGGSSARGSVNHKIPGFASGVNNFRGGLAYVHGGEVLANLAPGTSVIPAHKVSNMMNSGGNGFIAEAKISMRDLVIAIHREEGLNKRTG